MRLQNKFILWIVVTIQLFALHSYAAASGGASSSVAASGEDTMALFTLITPHSEGLVCREELELLKNFKKIEVPAPLNKDMDTLNAQLKKIHDGDSEALVMLADTIRSTVTEGGNDFLFLCVLWGLSGKITDESCLRLGLSYHNTIPIVKPLGKDFCAKREGFWLEKVLETADPGSLNYLQADALLHPDNHCDMDEDA